MSSPTARGSAAAALSAPVFPSVETEARMLTNQPGPQARSSARVTLWRMLRPRRCTPTSQGLRPRRRSLRQELRPGCTPYQPGTEGRISAGVILWHELRPAYELQTGE